MNPNFGPTISAISRFLKRWSRVKSENAVLRQLDKTYQCRWSPQMSRSYERNRDHRARLLRVKMIHMQRENPLTIPEDIPLDTEGILRFAVLYLDGSEKPRPTLDSLGPDPA